MKIFKAASILILFFTLSCDPLRKNKCEWYIVPDIKNSRFNTKTEMKLCLRNYQIGKQRCLLVGSPSFAEKIHQKVFYYRDVEISKDKIIIAARTCEGEMYMDPLAESK